MTSDIATLPLVPAKAGTQFFDQKQESKMDSRLRGNERSET
jgi:hypothetical protein